MDKFGFNYKMKELATTCMSAVVFSLLFTYPSISQEPRKLDSEHLPNAIQIHSKVISGGQPAGERAFRELKALGVKTIISVDGAKPEVELAKKYNLRYVHLPHGYDGISSQRSTELAKAVRDLDGPIYIHCHHGKHRSPTAAAVACVSVGFLEQNASLNILKLAGTNRDYRGLFAAATRAERIDDSVLDALQIEFPQIAKLTPIAEAMVALDQTHDHLKQFAAAGWARLPAHPDLDPEHEALILREHFTEMLRLDGAANQPEKYRLFLAESELLSRSLQSELRQWNESNRSASPPMSIGSTFERINSNCTSCHRQFRD